MEVKNAGPLTSGQRPFILWAKAACCRGHDKLMLRIFAVLFSASLLCATAQGRFERALKIYNAADYATAFNEFSALAESGSPEAQYYIGVMYHLGQGVKADLSRAISWFYKSARQRYAPACVVLGVLYSKGQGVRKSEATALQWWKIAADQGEPTAQGNLGLHYMRAGNYAVAADNRRHLAQA